MPEKPPEIAARTQPLSWLVDRIIPDDMSDDVDVLFRMRVVSGWCVCVGVLMLAVLSIRLGMGGRAWADGAVGAVGIVSLALPVFIRRTGRFEVAAYILIFAIVLVMTARMISSGGPYGPPLAVLPLIPIAAALLLDERAAIRTVVLTLVCCAVVALLSASGIITPQVTEATASVVVNFAALVVNTMAAGVLIAVYFVRQRSMLARRLHSERRARLAMDGLGAGVWEWNPGTSESYLSSRALALLGQSAATGAKKSSEMPLLSMLPIDAVSLRTAFAGLQADGDTFDVTLRLMQDDVLEHVRLSGVLEQLEGAQVRIVGMIRNVTAELREQTRRTDFVATVSHELRTPVNGMMGMARLLADTELNADQRHMLGRISASGEGLIRVVNDVLDFSRIEMAAVSLDAQPFDVRGLVLECAELFEGNARAKGNELVVDVDPRLPLRAVGDSLRLRQILANLVSNAVKFTDNGSIVVRAAISDDEGSLELAVRDTGIGIRPDQYADVFRPFEQGDASTTRQYGGTGLGLAICQRLVALMDGEIRFDSEPSCGSTFEVSIPLQFEGGVPRASGAFAGQLALLCLPESALCDALSKSLVVLGFEVTHVTGLIQLAAKVAPDARFEIAFVEGGGRNTNQIVSYLRGTSSDIRVVFIAKGDDSDVSGVVLRSVFDDVALYRAVVTALTGELLSQPTQVAVGLSQSFAAEYPRSILLVEDDATNREVAMRLLQRLGYAPDSAKDGVEAVSLAQRQAYDVILMDMHLPLMDGIEATRRIRASSASAGARIVAFTANVLPNQLSEFRAAGAQSVLSKPVDLDKLKALLAQRLTPSRAVADAAASDLAVSDGSSHAPRPAPTGLQALYEGEPAKLKALYATFFAEAAEQIREMRASLHTPYAQTVIQSHTHRLKSSSASMGLLDVQSESIALELRAATGAPADDWLDELVVRLEDARQEVSTLD